MKSFLSACETLHAFSLAMKFGSIRDRTTDAFPLNTSSLKIRDAPIVVGHRTGCRHGGSISRKITGCCGKGVHSPASVPEPIRLELDDVRTRAVWCNQYLPRTGQLVAGSCHLKCSRCHARLCV